MRTMTLLTTTLAALGAARCGTAPVPCPDGVGTDTQSLKADTFHRAGFLKNHDSHRMMMQRIAARTSGQAFTALSTQNNQCADVTNSNLANGAQVQLWQCAGSDNQKWRIEGPLLQTSSDLCLDVPNGHAYNGVNLQVFKCDGQNKNQAFTYTASNQLQWTGSNFCVDVTGGAFWSGTKLQLWQCVPGSQNQAWVFGQTTSAPTPQVLLQAPQQGTSSATSTNWLGHWAISLDDFVAKHPECKTYKPAILAAANDQGINPTFLASICEVESSCGVGLVGSSAAWAGPWQFMDQGAWDTYGGKGKDRTNYWDAAYGSARYFRALLDGNGWNLDAAIRSYNGPISSGGLPSYQQDVYNWMSGSR